MKPYRVEEFPHGVAIFGPIPLRDFGGKLAKFWKKRGYTLADCVISERLGATVVFTSPVGSNLWRAEIEIDKWFASKAPTYEAVRTGRCYERYPKDGVEGYWDTEAEEWEITFWGKSVRRVKLDVEADARWQVIKAEVSQE
jgi:hypothetical protein